MFRKKLLSLLVAGLLVISGSVALAQDERVLVVGHAEFVDSYDPGRAFSTTGFVVHRAVYQTLVTFPQGTTESIDPMLAESWEISDDGLEYTFTIDSDATFSDGSAVTAEDVVFSFERLQNLQGNPAFLADTIGTVEALDEQTVLVTLVQPDPSLLARLINSAFSISNADAIIEQGGASGEDAPEVDTAEEWLNSNSAGSGPYIMDSWEPQTETVLVRNPNFWGEPAYFDRIVIVNIPEAAVQQTTLEAGDIDIATDITPDQIESLRAADDIDVTQEPTSNLHFLTMNTDPEVGGPLADPTVQRAVRLALDYEGYVDIWGGVAPPSIIPVGFIGAYGEDAAFQRNVEEARALLAEAGYPDGFETTLSYPQWTFAGVTWDTNAQKIQSDLAEVGIAVNLDPGEVSVQFESYRNGEQALGYWFWHPDYLDPGNHLVFMPGRTLGQRVNWTDENADAEIIELRDRADVALDLEERIEIFQAIQDYMQESGPWAPFLQNGIQVAHTAAIEGDVYHPQYILDLTQLSLAE